MNKLILTIFVVVATGMSMLILYFKPENSGFFIQNSNVVLAPDMQNKQANDVNSFN